MSNKVSRRWSIVAEAKKLAANSSQVAASLPDGQGRKIMRLLEKSLRAHVRMYLDASRRAERLHKENNKLKTKINDIVAYLKGETVMIQKSEDLLSQLP